MEPMEEVPLIQLGDAELERLVGWINTGLIKRLLLTNFNSKLLASYFGPSLNSHKTTHESSVEVRETRRYAALHFFIHSLLICVTRECSEPVLNNAQLVNHILIKFYPSFHSSKLLGCGSNYGTRLGLSFSHNYHSKCNYSEAQININKYQLSQMDPRDARAAPPHVHRAADKWTVSVIN